MNFSIFLWYMKKFNIFTASCTLPLSLSLSPAHIHSTMLILRSMKNVKIDFRIILSAKSTLLLLLYEKKSFILSTSSFLHHCHFFMRQCTQNTHTPHYELAIHSRKVNNVRGKKFYYLLIALRLKFHRI